MKDTFETMQPMANNPIDPNDFNNICDAMREQMAQEIEHPLRPITMPQPEAHAPTTTREDNNIGFDFSRIDNPQTSPTDITELPIWGLPDTLQSVVDGVAQGYQCCRDFAVASLFSASATLLGKRVSGEFGNHVNYSTLWIAIVGDSSSGKTAPLSFFFKPIERMERESFDKYRQELKQCSDKDCKPDYHHSLLNNPSDESVLFELSVNGSMCWKADELVTIFDGFGQYSKCGGTIVGNLLSIFSNEDVCITRATKEPQYLKEPNLNIIGGIQPPILKRVMMGKGFVDDGLFQRFLFVYPEGNDVPQYKEVRIDTTIKSWWDEKVHNLSSYPEIMLKETPEAKKLHVDTINRWRDECNEHYRKNDVMKSLLRKLEIHLCRWSIVTTVLSGNTVINADAMRYSVECMEYFKMCGEKVFCLIANKKNDEPKRGDVFKLLKKWYPNLNQSGLANSLGLSQQAISKFLNQ